VGKLERGLKANARVALDTAVFIYHLEGNQQYLELTSELFAGIEEGRWQGVTSVITLMELSVVPWRVGRGEVARHYETLLVNYPNLTLAEVTRQIARRAARLRAEFAIGAADAIHISTSLVHDADAFITNDRRLSRMGPTIEILLLDELNKLDR
jgi:predicted nucleic acid-binding protein